MNGVDKFVCAAADVLQVAKYPCLSVILALDSRLRLVGKLEGVLSATVLLCGERLIAGV
jgi:hypothetical protein